MQPTWMDSVILHTLRAAQVKVCDITAALTSESGVIKLNGLECILSAVQRESGGGRKFNLEVRHNGRLYKLYAEAA